MKSYIEKALEKSEYFSKNGSSTYYNDRGQLVPRVTEIISRMNHSDGLMYWANSLGFKGIKYKDALNKAANMGTEAHEAIEKFLKEKLETTSNIPFMGFMQWYNLLTTEYNLDIKLIYSEYKLVCDWFGGTLDALLEIGGNLYIIDFKTSNHVTYNYFLQLAAYIYILRNYYGVEVYGCGIVKLNKKTINFEEYIIDYSQPDYTEFMTLCETTFLSLVYAYYHKTRTENYYNTLWGNCY